MKAKGQDSAGSLRTQHFYGALCNVDGIMYTCPALGRYYVFAFIKISLGTPTRESPRD